MTAAPVMSITDELVAELEAAANAAIAEPAAYIAAGERGIEWNRKRIGFQVLATDTVVLALLAERAELKRQVEGLKDTLAGASIWMKDVTDKVLYPVSLNGSDYVARTAEGLGSCTPDLFKTIDAAMQAAQ
jgi:hypothetical protein